MQLATPNAAFTTFAPFDVSPWQHLDIPQRLARVYRRYLARFGDPEMFSVGPAELANEPETCDLTVAEIEANSGRAKQLIADKAAEPLPYERETRVRLGSDLILGLMPAIPTCHTTLREGGFTNTELGDLWDEIIARAADAFHADRAPLRPTGVGMPDWARQMLERNAE